MAVRRLCLLFFVFIFYAGCYNADDEKRVVENTMVAFFKAIEEKNYTKIRELAAPDFLLFENGAAWNIDSLIIHLQKLPCDKIAYSLTSFAVTNNEELAAIRYNNTGNFYINNVVVKKAKWLESAFLKKSKT